MRLDHLPRLHLILGRLGAGRSERHGTSLVERPKREEDRGEEPVGAPGRADVLRVKGVGEEEEDDEGHDGEVRAVD